jgi:hypothetical protein
VSIANVCRARGTRCGRRIFVFSAGMVQTRALEIELLPLSVSEFA